MGVNRDDSGATPMPTPAGHEDSGVDRLPTNVIQVGAGSEEALDDAPPELHVDSGVLPMPTAPQKSPAPPPGRFEADIDVDQGLVEQLQAVLPPDVEEPSQAERFPAPPAHALPYWEALVQRLQAEIGVAEPTADRHRAAVLHYELARLLDGRLGRAADALAAYQSAFALDPGFAPNLRALRRALGRRGNFAQAALVLDAEMKAASTPGERAAILIERGRLRERLLDDLDGAAADYAAVLEIDPQEPVALLALCDLQARRGEFGKLVALLEKRAAGARDPALRAALLTEAATVAEDRMSDLQRATDLYHRAHEIDPICRPALRALVRIYRRQGRYAELVALYETAASIAPTSAETASWLHRSARLYRDRLRDRGRALATLEQAARENPEDRAIQVDLAGLYEEQRRWNDLADALERAAALAGDPRQAANLNYRLGQVCIERLYDEERAVRALREAVTLAPDHHPARRSLGKLYAKRERWTELIGLLADEAELTADPERKAARYYRIADLFERKIGDLERALESYERALAAQPGYDPALKGLGRICDALGSYADLVQSYERELAATRDREEQAHLLVRIAQTWEEKLGEPMAAVASYERLAAISPNHPVALRALGRLYAHSERWRDLVDVHLREAEQLLDPAQIVPLLVRAGEVFEEKLAEPERAVGCYRQALVLRPDFLPALLALGRLAQRLGRWEDLIEMYRREIEVSRDPEQVTALHFKIGEILEQQLSRADEAARCYLEALRLAPHFQPAREALARIHESRGNWSELALLLARGDEPQDPRARAAHWYRLAEIQEKYLSNPSAATENYRRALKVRPDEQAARSALERLLDAAGDRQGLIALYSGDVTSSDPDLQVEALQKLARVWASEEHDLDRAAQALSQALDLAPRNRFARRELIRLYTRLERWDAILSPLDAEREGSHDPRWQLAAALEMAAIREYKLNDPQAAAETYYQILAREPNHWQALFALETHYRATGNTSGLAQVLARYVALAFAPTEAASYLVSVGAGHEACGATERAIRAYHDSLEKLPRYLPPLRALGRIYRLQEDAQAQALASEAEAQASLDGDRRAALEFEAGELWRTRLENPERAIAAYRRALTAQPSHAGATLALDGLLSTREAWAELAAHLEQAAAQVPDSTARRDIEVRLAELSRSRLDDRARAKAAYRRALELDPRYRPTLQALAALCREGAEWGELAELDQRQLALAKGDPQLSRALHYELGVIWDERIPDARRAIEQYQKVLAIDPADLTTLDRISTLLVRERDWPSAEQATSTLIARAPSREAKIKYFLRLAHIFADGLGDPVRAAGACRDALALDPNDLEATERLAFVLARLKDWKALGAHLDGVLRTHRARIAEEPWRADSYHILRKVFEWQKAYDRVYCCSALLRALGEARPEDEAFVRANQAAALQPARQTLSSAALDEYLLAPAERGSLREILRIGEEVLDRMYPPDLARHQVTRAHRTSAKTHGRLWEAAGEVARVYGVPAFELYVGTAFPDEVAVENADPPALVIGSRWLQHAGAQELKFLLGRALGRARARLLGALKLPVEELGQFIAALLTLEVGSFVPPYPAPLIEPLARRMVKLLPKKALRELGPYALEVAGGSFEPLAWKRAFEATAVRAGTLACADIPVAIETCLRLDAVWDDPAPPRNGKELAGRLERSPRALEVLAFAVSDDHFELRQQLGISVSP